MENQNFLKGETTGLKGQHTTIIQKLPYLLPVPESDVFY